MRDALTELKNYCADLGADPDVAPDDEARRRLPPFLSQIYDPVRANLFGRNYPLFLIKGEGTPTPNEVEKHADILRKQFGQDVGFVFPSLPAYDRNRLLKRRIPFIVPRRQMFLPGTMVDLREVHGPGFQPKTSAPLSMPAQLLLLFHLQKGHQDGPFALHAWATALNYSKMSITRAQRELVSAGLAAPREPGREVIIQFRGDRRELWAKALPLLRSPVQKEGYYRLSPLNQGTLEVAGLTALAHYTDMAEGFQPCLAAWRKVPPAMEPVPYRDVDTVAVQTWWYPPKILAEDDRVVDRLSLYLSLRESPDERVQAALATVLEGVKW